MTYGRKSCKGHCKREHWEHKDKLTRYICNVYARGYKNCSVCKIFIIGIFNQCPCCGVALKCKPKSNKYRRVLNASLGVVYH